MTKEILDKMESRRIYRNSNVKNIKKHIPELKVKIKEAQYAWLNEKYMEIEIVGKEHIYLT